MRLKDYYEMFVRKIEEVVDTVLQEFQEPPAIKDILLKREVRVSSNPDFLKKELVKRGWTCSPEYCKKYKYFEVELGTESKLMFWSRTITSVWFGYRYTEIVIHAELIRAVADKGELVLRVLKEFLEAVTASPTHTGRIICDFCKSFCKNSGD